MLMFDDMQLQIVDICVGLSDLKYTPFLLATVGLLDCDLNSLL